MFYWRAYSGTDSPWPYSCITHVAFGLFRHNIGLHSFYLSFKKNESLSKTTALTCNNMTFLRLKCLWSKNYCCLFERLFKGKKYGVFLFGMSFFVLEIFTFLYYANEGCDDVIDRSTKTVQHSIKNISGNIKAVFFKLGPRNVHHKRNKMRAVMPLPNKQQFFFTFFK